MHDYQYRLEVVSVLPPEVLARPEDSSQRKLILRCARRDALMEGTAAPSTFEVRNAPSFENIFISLVTVDHANGSEHVEARSSEPLLVGGPHRTVGAVWVPLNAIPVVEPVAAAAAPPPVCRIFLAWSMTRMDGRPIRADHLEIPGKESPLAGLPAAEGSPSPTHLNSSRRDLTLNPYGAPTDGLNAGTTPEVASPSTTTTSVVATLIPCPLPPRVIVAPGVLALQNVHRGEVAPLPIATIGAGLARQSSSTGNASGLLSAEASSGPVLVLPSVFGNNAANTETSAAERKAHVYALLGAEQKSAQRVVVSARGDSSRSSGDHAGGIRAVVPHGSVVNAEGSSTTFAGAGSPQVAERQVSWLEDVGTLQSSPLTVLSSSKARNAATSPQSPPSGPAAESSEIATRLEEGTEDSGAPAVHVGSRGHDSAPAEDGAEHPTWVDYYASSTQAIGFVPLQTRYRNLYTVPSPYLLDRLRNEMVPRIASSSSLPSAQPAPVISHELWRERHRERNVCRWITTSDSAQEEIRREHEARQNPVAPLALLEANGPENTAPSSTSPLVLVKGSYTEASAEPALTVLRQRALHGLRRHRVMY
ncbi:hypothetical protein JKF63_02553 [Porcisia hertigi]|uniref:Uncharacterized protein n=1 Tax=Porcisia hertigi TaxID=2761500 RepID=A0A836L3X4_9TRYP|nr:hypothetical protein JKF63_02553 [Porcisia hertigi]